MKKIPSVFVRPVVHGKPQPHVIDQVTPGCEWVVNGEGVASRKWDGTACLVEGGRLYKRYDAKHGKVPPPGWHPAQDPDPNTGHWPGWMAVDMYDPADRWHVEAWIARGGRRLEDGTYELCGPRIGANPDGFETHVFQRHGNRVFSLAPRTFAGLREWLGGLDIEGVVFAHPDGRMAKVKKSDLNLPRRP
jgi:hypothetical protein